MTVLTLLISVRCLQVTYILPVFDVLGLIDFSDIGSWFQVSRGNLFFHLFIWFDFTNFANWFKVWKYLICHLFWIS